MLRAVAAGLLLTMVFATACGSAATVTRSYAFGIRGGNVRPWTVTIAPGGRITVAGLPLQARKSVSRQWRTALARRVDSERFFSLPGLIRCRAQNPDVATAWVRVRRGGRTHTVVAQSRCSTRFDAVRVALYRATGVHA